MNTPTVQTKAICQTRVLGEAEAIRAELEQAGSGLLIGDPQKIENLRKVCLKGVALLEREIEKTPNRRIDDPDLKVFAVVLGMHVATVKRLRGCNVL